MKKKTSPAQERARNKWDSKNKEKVKYTHYKSIAKTFLNKMIAEKDLEEFKKYIEKREQEFNLVKKKGE